MLKRIKQDACIPSLSASLEDLKYCGGAKLPMQSMEVEMDLFGIKSSDNQGI